MAGKAEIDQRVWTDSDFLELSNDGMLLWFYLMTNISALGVFQFDETVIAAKLKLKPKRVLRLLENPFENATRKRFWKVDFATKTLWFPNRFRYVRPSNRNHCKGWLKEIRALPSSWLQREIVLAFVLVARDKWPEVEAEAADLLEVEVEEPEPIPCNVASKPTTGNGQMTMFGVDPEGLSQVDQDYQRLMRWWNGLSDDVREGKVTERNKSLRELMKRLQHDPDLRACFDDLDGLTKAIQEQNWLHRRSYFTLEWLLCTNRKDLNWNAANILKRKYVNVGSESFGEKRGGQEYEDEL